MTLGEKQRLFAKLVAELILWAYDNDFEVTFGEATRPDWVAEIYAQQGKGIRNTLHALRLAIDLNLFIDTSEGGDEDVYQPNSEAYLPLGEYWESLHPLCRWGGRFSRPDGNHFSMEHEGVK